MIHRYARHLGHLAFSLVQDLAADIDVVAHDQHDTRGSIVQDEAARVKLVVDVFGGWRGAEVPDQSAAQPGSDVGGGCPNQERFLVGRFSGDRRSTQEQTCCQGRNVDRYMLVSPLKSVSFAIAKGMVEYWKEGKQNGNSDDVFHGIASCASHRRDNSS